MKIITKILSLEVTELCNLNCRHCLAGKSCNLTMSDDVIRNVFKEVKVVEELLLTGGEVFLAYDQVKKVLKISSECGAKILNCSIVTNGCIYDERIYKLLDEYFNDDYSIYVSNDDFHDKSIMRIYNKEGKSDNPCLAPRNIQDIKNNMLQHLENPHFGGYKNLGDKLIDVGRAKNLDMPKHEFEVMGYFYDFYKDYLMVGPVLFVSADGYITEGNDEIEHYEKGSIGNVLRESISDSVIRGGQHIKCNDQKEFFEFLARREYEYQSLKGRHYIYEDGKMKEINIKRDESHFEEIMRLQEFINSLENEDDLFKKVLSYDFSKYPYDLSLVDHSYI